LALPRVVIHSAISLDGRIDGFQPEIGAYYDLIQTWDEDATLCGSGTILAATEQDADDAPPLGPEDDSKPLLAVVDSRGRVRSWGAAMHAGHWGSALALSAEETPKQHLEYLAQRGVESAVVGTDRVDLGAALELLAERGARTVRVDAGPELTSALLGAGLVDELSLLVHPVLVGSGRTFAGDLDAPAVMELNSQERVDPGLLWTRWTRGA
jgi:2,5-diamino-6-(ribosylamino)-4(3H)-pyrimidinone 5'-phosphate reductase